MLDSTRLQVTFTYRDKTMELELNPHDDVEVNQFLGRALGAVRTWVQKIDDPNKIYREVRDLVIASGVDDPELTDIIDKRLNPIVTTIKVVPVESNIQ
jgi:hypothetical protein